MDELAEGVRARDNGTKPSDRKGSSRQRGESSGGAGTSPPSGRPPQDNRRRRGNDHRYAGWGDGVERAHCSRAAHCLPVTFPVESHIGAATIPATIVARRPDAVLLCTFSHFGPHAWPNGEIVGDGHVDTAASGQNQ